MPSSEFGFSQCSPFMPILGGQDSLDCGFKAGVKGAGRAVCEEPGLDMERGWGDLAELCTAWQSCQALAGMCWSPGCQQPAVLTSDPRNLTASLLPWALSLVCGGVGTCLIAPPTGILCLGYKNLFKSEICHKVCYTWMDVFTRLHGELSSAFDEGESLGFWQFFALF